MSLHLINPKRLLIIFAIVLLLALASYVVYNIVRPPHVERFGLGRQFIPSTGRFISYDPLLLQLAPNLSNKDIHVKGTFQVDLDSTLERQENLVLVTLVNYKQVPLYVDNRKQNLYRFSMERNVQAHIPVEFDVPNAEGLQRVSLLIFRDVDNTIEDPAQKASVYAYLFDILPGAKSSFSFVPIRSTDTLTLTPRTSFANDIVVNQTVDDSEPLDQIDVKANEPLTLYAHLVNRFSPTGTYALLAFKDWQQVDLFSASQPFIFGDIKNNEDRIVPMALAPENTPGRYYIQYVFVQEPFENVPVLSTGSSKATPTPAPNRKAPKSTWSKRVTVDVK
jgi:hypothetical protein